MAETCIGRVLGFEDGGGRIAVTREAPRALTCRDVAPTFAGCTRG
jgi:hypothetical protein